MDYIKNNFWQILTAGAVLLWVGWVSLGVHHSVSEDRLTKTTDQFARLVELMVITHKEMVTKKGLHEIREDMRDLRKDMRDLRKDMRDGFARIDRRLEALEQRLANKPPSR